MRKSAQYSLTYIISERSFRSHGPFLSPHWGPQGKMTKPVYILGQRNFIWLLNHENRPSSHPTYVLDKFGPIGPFILGPGAYIFKTLLKVVTMSIKNKVHVNPFHWKLFAEQTKTWILTYFGLIRGQKGSQNMAPGAHILHTSKSNSSELNKHASYKTSGNLLPNRQTRRSENDNTPQPLDQWTNSPFMGQQVGNCKSFTLIHYLAHLFAMHCDRRASPSWIQHWIQLASLLFQVDQPYHS